MNKKAELIIPEEHGREYRVNLGCIFSHNYTLVVDQDGFKKTLFCKKCGKKKEW